MTAEDSQHHRVDEARRRMSLESCSSLPPMSLWVRVSLWLSGVLFPAICIGLAAFFGTPFDSGWQSGKLDTYVGLLMQFPGIAPFLPLIGLCMASMTAWVFWPQTERFLVVRAGLYLGVPLSAQFLVFVIVTSSVGTLIYTVFAILPLWGVVGLIVLLLGFARRQFTLLHLLGLITICAVLAAIAAGTETDWRSMLLIPLVAVAPATPTLNVVAYLYASILVWRRAWLWERAPRMRTGLIGGGTLLAWAISWKLAVDVMLDEYAQLPTTPPTCYVSRAAAEGHPCLVRSRVVGGTDANPLRVNPQMQRLKFLEFALLATSPAVHGWVRALYDRVGPGLARVCGANAWIADLAYLMLKPLEAAAVAIRVVSGISSAQIDDLYVPRSDSSTRVAKTPHPPA